MEIVRKIILLTALLFVLQSLFSQNEKAFCKAVENMNFKKVERIVHKVIRKNSKGQEYFNGEGSGYQTDLSPSLDSITNWLKKSDAVEDACWDKCQEKIAIFPGNSSIGVKFKTKTGIVEKCFLIQMGKTGQINLLGWKPRIGRTKTKLVYVRMYECENFIEQQKANCDDD